MATALATAGLLAGIFGSTLAPVAQAASSSINTKLIASELHGNLDNDFQDYWYGNADAAGTAIDPSIIYAPENNDGGVATGSNLNTDHVLNTYVSDSDIETLGGTTLSSLDDVSVTVSATNGLLVELQDDDTYSCSDSESDYVASDTVSAYDGFSICMTADDDDSSYTSTVTVKVNGVSITTLVVKVVGPGQTVSIADRTGGWIDMDNNAVSNAARISFLDKSGYNLWTSLRDATDGSFDGDANDIGGDDFGYLIEGYWKAGYESIGYATHFAVDNIAIGDDFNDDLTDTVYAQSGSARNVTFDSSFCDSDLDSVGDTHTVYVVMDYNDQETVSTNDTKSNGIPVKCSDDGWAAEITGIDFAGATSVEAGDTIPLQMHIQDGSGNPQGLGSDYDLDFGQVDFRNSLEFWETGEYTALAFSPMHPDLLDSGYFAVDGVAIELEANDDSDTTCSGVDYESGDMWSDGESLNDYLAGGTGFDLIGAGIVQFCYTASQLKEDLGVNTVKLPLQYAYTDDAYDVLGAAPKSFKASINVVPAGSGVGTGALSATVKVGKRTVSVTGPVGAKVTFVVEDSNMNVKTYVRIVQATGALAGKAALTFTKLGTYKVYATYNEQITELATIKVKL